MASGIADQRNPVQRELQCAGGPGVCQTPRQNLKWELRRLPDHLSDMRRSSDAVVNAGDELFLRKADTTSTAIYSYSISANEWNEVVHQPLHYDRCSLAYYKQLIVIGGSVGKEDKAHRSSAIVEINGKAFTSMPTSRSRTTALIGHSSMLKTFVLIVIGGEDNNDESLKIVEIFDVSRRVWYTAQDTPETLCSTSGTIVNGDIYLLGGWTKRNIHSSAVFMCNLDDLINSALQPQTSNNVWKKLPDLPVIEATCTSFMNQVFVVGGLANSVAVHDIRIYNKETKRWEVIGYLKHARYICFVAGLPDKLVIIGGKKGSASNESTIEIFSHCGN